MSEQTAKQPRHQYQCFLQSLPEDWDRKEIRQLGTVVGGGTPSRDVPSFWRGTIPWVTPGEVSGNAAKFLHDTNDHVTASGLAGSGANLLPAGSLMVTTRATLGARAINAVPMATNQGFKSIVFKQAADPGFYLHLFEKVQPELVRRASGTTFLEISGVEFSGIEVPSPCSDEKRLITKILDTLDSAIHETEAVIAKLKAVKQGLLHDLLTRGIDATGELRPPQTEAPHLYKSSPLGWIPKEWDVASLACLLSEPPRNGLYKPPHLIGRGTLLVGQTAFTEDGSVDFDMARRAQVGHIDLSAFGLRAGDLLMSRVFATLDGVAQPVIVPELPEDAVYESNMMRLRTKAGVVTSSVLFNLLKLPSIRAAVRSRAFLSNQASINRQGICSIELPLPPWEEQLAADARIKTLVDQLKHEAEALSKYRAQKAGLMDDLLTGRVRVTSLLEAAAA